MSLQSPSTALFSKSLETHFCNVTCKNNFVKHIENSPKHLSEKFIGDNLSITDIALKISDLSINGIAQGVFEVIDYRYPFGGARFIVVITEYNTKALSRASS